VLSLKPLKVLNIPAPLPIYFLLQKSLFYRFISVGYVEPAKGPGANRTDIRRARAELLHRFQEVI
jgi:hypothetical protein